MHTATANVFFHEQCQDNLSLYECGLVLTGSLVGSGTTSQKSVNSFPEKVTGYLIIPAALRP
jgi:hypothetical protein